MKRGHVEVERPVEQRRVVHFSDIHGFTEYGEAADPEDIVERLNAYFDEMAGAIARHGGVVVVRWIVGVI